MILLSPLSATLSSAQWRFLPRKTSPIIPNRDLTSKNRDTVFCQTHLIQRGSRVVAIKQHPDTHLVQMETEGVKSSLENEPSEETARSGLSVKKNGFGT